MVTVATASSVALPAMLFRRPGPGVGVPAAAAGAGLVCAALAVATIARAPAAAEDLRQLLDLRRTRSR